MMIADDIRGIVSRLVGGYEHVVTKADLAKLEVRVETRFTEMQIQLLQQKTRLLLKFGGLLIVTAGVSIAVTDFWASASSRRPAVFAPCAFQRLIDSPDILTTPLYSSNRAVQPAFS